MLTKHKTPTFNPGHQDDLVPPPVSQPEKTLLPNIIANAAENQRKREQERRQREQEAKEARARFALD